MLALEKLRSLAICAWTRAVAMLSDDEGATLVEYGLLVALIAVVAMAALSVLGVRINAMFCSVAGTLGGSC